MTVETAISTVSAVVLMTATLLVAVLCILDSDPRNIVLGFSVVAVYAVALVLSWTKTDISK